MAAPTPKSLYNLIQSLSKAALQPPSLGYFTDGSKLRAKARRYRNKTVSVGNTVFVFNDEGITEVIEQGYTRYDFESLLKLPGVEKID